MKPHYTGYSHGKFSSDMVVIFLTPDSFEKT